jgi:hypothetical protein
MAFVGVGKSRCAWKALGDVAWAMPHGCEEVVLLGRLSIAGVLGCLLCRRPDSRASHRKGHAGSSQVIRRDQLCRGRPGRKASSVIDERQAPPCSKVAVIWPPC